jgi:PAS domain S-box-containing protein
LDFIVGTVGVGRWWNHWPLDKLNWNQQMKGLFHLPPDAVVDLPTFYKLIHPEDIEPRLRAIEKAVKEKGLYDFTFRTVAPDGSGKIKWVRSIGRAFYDAKGRPRTISGITLDVTPQKQLENALRQSEACFRAMAEMVPDILYTCLPDGHCDYINHRFYAFTGMPKDAALGFGWLSAIHPDDASRAKVQPSAGKHPQPSASIRNPAQWSATLRIRCANGDYRWFISKAVPVVDGQGRTQKWFGCVTDIDDLFKMEKALEASEERLRALNHALEERVAERTATLQQTVTDLEAFTYTIAHDLRAPLRAQRGYANLLIEEFGEALGETGRGYAQSIAIAAERLDALVRDLLTLARLSREALDFAPLDLGHTAREVLEALAPEIQSQKAVVSVEQPLLPVVGHSRLLNQVLHNLLSNAIKFVKPGASPEVQLATEKRDEWVRLWVKDNGLGIAPEYQEQIFEAFQRLHNMAEYPGTGIGLAIVKKATERMGGRVGVESKPGMGSRFWVELPGAAAGARVSP